MTETNSDGISSLFQNIIHIYIYIYLSIYIYIYVESNRLTKGNLEFLVSKQWLTNQQSIG